MGESIIKSRQYLDSQDISEEFKKEFFKNSYNIEKTLLNTTFFEKVLAFFGLGKKFSSNQALIKELAKIDYTHLQYASNNLLQDKQYLQEIARQGNPIAQQLLKGIPLKTACINAQKQSKTITNEVAKEQEEEFAFPGQDYIDEATSALEQTKKLKALEKQVSQKIDQKTQNRLLTENFLDENNLLENDLLEYSELEQEYAAELQRIKQEDEDDKIAQKLSQEDDELEQKIQKQLQKTQENLQAAKKEIALENVEKDPLSFRKVSDEFKNDKEIALAAVKQDGMTLAYASDNLKNDAEVVMAATKQNPQSVEFASKQFRNMKQSAANAANEAKQKTEEQKVVEPEEQSQQQDAVEDMAKKYLANINANALKTANQQSKNIGQVAEESLQKPYDLSQKGLNATLQDALKFIEKENAKQAEQDISQNTQEELFTQDLMGGNALQSMETTSSAA